MVSGFGKGYDFEMKRFKLDKVRYFMRRLEVLEERIFEKEERFGELQRYLGE